MRVSPPRSVACPPWHRERASRPENPQPPKRPKRSPDRSVASYKRKNPTALSSRVRPYRFTERLAPPAASPPTMAPPPMAATTPVRRRLDLGLLDAESLERLQRAGCRRRGLG